jgi:hypothetical protein
VPMLTSMSYVTARHEVKPSTGLHVGSVSRLFVFLVILSRSLAFFCAFHLGTVF